MPDFRLSLRSQDVRGEQSAAIVEVDRPDSSMDWVIFIHGFHNSRQDAETHWQVLRGLCRFGGGGDRVAIGQLLWPGDQHGVMYPKMLRPAERAGRKLAKYLVAHPLPRVTLVGYSLGAVVALAAADALRGRRRLQGLVLLGAAVDVAHLEESGRYDFRYATREGVAHHEADTVLLRHFPRGERLAAPFEERAVAVGLHGGPDERPWRREDSKQTHHEYWRMEVSAELMGWAAGVDVTTPAVHAAATKDADSWRFGSIDSWDSEWE